MAHYTNVDGTRKSIVGGLTKIDGTTYQIVGGKTKIDETSYDIDIDILYVTAKVWGDGSEDYCYATINGTKYIGRVTLTCEPGVTMSFKASHSSSTKRAKSTIVLNGVEVARGSSTTTGGATHSFTASSAQVAIDLSYGTEGSTITITTS